MSSLSQEYSVVENGIGLIELTHSVLCFKGADRKKFLQGAMSNDIQKLKKDELLPTCFLNPKGRLIATTKLFENGEEIWGMVSLQGFELLKQALQTQLLFSETEFSLISEPYSWIFGIGKKADVIPAEVEISQVHSGDSRLHGNDKSVFPLRNSGWCYPSFLILTSQNKREEIFSALQQNKKKYPIEKIEKETFNVLRIESGIPLYGVEMDEKTIPNEVNLDSYISYTKGCYTGQETISRIKHYGHVNKQLAKIKFDIEQKVPEGTAILRSEKEVGKITSSTYSPKFRSQIALGILQYESAKEGTEISIRSGEKEVKGIIL